MFLQSSRIMVVHKNNFDISVNPQEINLSKSRFQSPSLKLGKIRSCKFIYQSPSRVQKVENSQPLAFSRHAHKLVVRKLPKFHNQILDNDQLKNSKIIENINHLRELEKRKLQMAQTRTTSAQKSKVYNQFVEVSRVLVDVKASKHPSQLRMNRSLSGSYQVIDSSRHSVIQGLKSGNSLFQSIVKSKQDSLASSRASELKRDQIKNSFGLAQSRYLSGIMTK